MNFGIIMYQTSRSKGQELVAQRITAELNRQGQRAHLITSRFHDSKPVISKTELSRSGDAVIREDDVLGIPVVRVSSSQDAWTPRRANFDNFMPILDRLVKQLELDVLLTHSTLWNGPEIAARFVAWNRKLRTEYPDRKEVLLCQMSHYQPPAHTRYDPKERTYREVWNEHSLARIIREADLLLVTTPLAARAMQSLGADKDRCLVFPGGIDVPPERTGEDIAEFRKRHDLSGSRIVSYLGTMEERKNPMAVLDVARELQAKKDLVFVLGGRPEGHYGRRIIGAAKKLRNVAVIGEVSEGDKASLIRSSYLNITMSRLEALGLAQLEFMSAGVPVVSSGVGGQSWIVQHGYTGIVLGGPEDVSGAVRAVSSLADNLARRNWLGRNAREFAEHFSMERLVAGLISRLKEIREGRPRGRPARLPGT